MTEHDNTLTEISIDGVLLTNDDLWKKVMETNFKDHINNMRIPINDVSINGIGIVENINLLLEAENNNTEHLSLKIEPDEDGILTYYVNKIPNGKVSSVKCNQIDGKYAYPIEFEIVCDDYFLILKSESDKITVESKPLPKTQLDE